MPNLLQPLMPMGARLAAQPWGMQPAGQPLQQDLLMPPVRRRRRRKKQLPLPSEEEIGMLGKSMGMVQYLGETLDKPGRAIRGLLAGRPEALLNLVPFSDTMELTDPQKATSGRDLLEMLGAVERNKPGLGIKGWDPSKWDWGNLGGDVAGFATEVALDPLTLLTGPLGATGALTKQGIAKVAAKAGKGARVAKTAAQQSDELGEMVARAHKAIGGEAPKTGRTLAGSTAAIAQQIREGDRGLLGLKMPFAKYPFKTFGAGSERAASALEKLFYGGKYVPSPFVPLRGLLSSTSGGKFSGATQKAMDLAAAERQMLLETTMDAMPSVMARENELMETFAEMAKHHKDVNGNPQAFSDLTRTMAEAQQGLSAQNVGQALKEYMGLAPDADIGALGEGAMRFTDRWHEYLDSLVGLQDDVYKRIDELGGSAREIEDTYAKHFARKPSDPGVLDKDFGKRTRPWFEWTQARKDWLKNYPGNTAGINAIARDPLITATHEAAQGPLKDALRTALEGMGVPFRVTDNVKTLQLAYLRARHVEPAFDRAVKSGLLDEATAATEYHRLFEQGLVDGKPAQPAIEDMLTHFRRYPEEVQQRGLFDRRPAEDMFDYLTHMLEREGSLRTAHNYVDNPKVAWDISEEGTKGRLGGVPLAEVWDRAGFKRRGLETFIRRKHNITDTGEDGQKLVNDMIEGTVVDPKAEEVLKNFSHLMEPGVPGAVEKFFGKVNAAYKGYWTIPFPAFHARNLLAGIWQNWADGDIGLTELLPEAARAFKYALTGKGQVDYLDEMVQLGLLKGHTRQLEVALAEDVAGAAGDVHRQLLGPGFKETVGQSGWHWLNPGATRGLTDEVREGGKLLKPARRNIAMAGGEKMYAVVEFANRAAPYNVLRRKGFTPAQAYRKVMRMQFDYGELSEIERRVGAAVIPFWTWTRKNIPYQLAKILERPGGRTAQTLRAFSQPSDEGEYRPAWLREGLAIPAGGTPEEKHYLMQGGLPIEDLNKFVWKGGAAPSTRTLSKFGSMLHPWIQAPVEQFAGKQLFSDRDLKDLRPLTGVSALDSALHYSPASRAVSTGRKLTDLRKPPGQIAANLATGLRFTTQDAQAAMLRDLREFYMGQLEENVAAREFTVPYVPKRTKESPAGVEAQADVERHRQLTELIKRLWAEREAKKK